MSRAFDGDSDNYLKLEGSSLGLSASGYTYAFRAKTDTPTVTQFVMANYQNGDYSTVDRAYTNETRSRFTVDHGSLIRNADVVVDTPTDTWTDYICIVTASDEPRLIALAGDVTAAASDGFPAISSPEFWIGRNHETFFPFSGKIKDLIIWNKVLSAGEITSYQSGDNTTASGDQVRKWLFDTSSLTDSIASDVLVENGSVPYVVLEGGPTITDIDTNDDVFPGQSAVITGTNFGGVEGDVSLGGVAQTVTAWADTEITITVVQSGLKYGDHDLIVTDDSAVSSAALTTTLSPSSTNQFVNVSSPVSDNTSLFFGASPAVATGDQLEAPLLTTQGKTLTINADGTFVITAASGLQTFSIRVWDATDETWSTSAIATINGAVTPPSSIGGSMARAMVNG